MAYFSLFILYGVPSKFTILSVTVLIVIKLNNPLPLISNLNTKSQTRIWIPVYLPWTRRSGTWL